MKQDVRSQTFSLLCLFAGPFPSSQTLFLRRHQNETVTCTQLTLGLLQMEGFGVKPVPDPQNHTQLGGREGGKKKKTKPTHFPAVVSLQSLPAQLEKGSKLLWLPSGEQGLRVARPVPTASPGSGHPLPPFHYIQAGVMLGCKVGRCSRESLFHPLLPCCEGLWDGGAFPPKAWPPPRAVGVPGPCYPLSPYRAQIQGSNEPALFTGREFLL